MAYTPLSEQNTFLDATIKFAGSVGIAATSIYVIPSFRKQLNEPELPNDPDLEYGNDGPLIYTGAVIGSIVAMAEIGAYAGEAYDCSPLCLIPLATNALSFAHTKFVKGKTIDTLIE